MSGSVTALVLRDTQHVLAAFSRKSGDDSEFNEDQLAQQYRDGLPIRLLPQSGLNPDPADPDVSGRSPEDVRFRIAPRFFEAVTIEEDFASVLSRPTRFTIDQGEPTSTPASTGPIESVKYLVDPTGVTVTLKPVDDNLLPAEIRVVCILLPQTSPDALVAGATIPKGTNASKPVSVKVPFPLVPAGDNHLLLLIHGFQPIWDKVDHAGHKERTWKPMSP